MDTLRVRDLSVVFLSYDEPNADDNFNLLSEQVENPIRVHGVTGFDAAHKAAAEAARTERFVLVDGDAQVYPEFWNLDFRLPDHYKNGVLSFCARNVVNELSYGYGGLKIWTRSFIQNMRTHEAADDHTTAFEFCWLPNYHHFATEWNSTHINASPKQAFRAGYRETVKLLCPEGVLHPFEKLPYGSQRKLVQWLTLGADAPNGGLCIAGAQTAYYHLVKLGKSPNVVNDYAAIDSVFDQWTAKPNLEGDDWRKILQDKDDWMYEVECGDHWPFNARQSRLVKTFIRKQRPKYLNPLHPCAWDTE